MNMRVTIALVLALAAPATAAADSVERLWTITDDECAAEAAATDGAGRLYVACYALYDRQWRLTAYDRDGALVAQRELNGLAGEPTPVGAFPRPEGVAIDEAAGVMYVAGALAVADSDDTVGAIVAVDTVDLELRWMVTLPSVMALGDVAIGPDGALTAVGTRHNGTDTDLVVVRVDADGVPQWTHTTDTGADDAGTTSFQTVVVDGAGAAYAVGDDVIVKLAAGGGAAWTVRRPALRIALQDDRYLVATSPLVPHGFTALLDLDGAVVWEAEVGGIALATADHGDVWVARTDYLAPADSDWEVFRIADDGEVRWSYTLGKARQDVVAALAIDAADNVYVTGQALVRGGFLGLFWVTRGTTIALGSDGALRWRYDDDIAVSPRELVRPDAQTTYVAGLTAHAAYRHELELPPDCEWWQWWCWW